MPQKATVGPSSVRPVLFRPISIAAAVALIAGAAFRICGAQGELWLDEIWSLHLIEQMKSGDVLPSIAYDNNHYLNTLYMALVGGTAAPLALRACSILLGTMTVAAAGWLQRDRGRFAVSATMALFAVAYPLVNAGSEARGYAGMLLCVLLAIGAAERARDEPRPRNDLVFGAACVVGVLFQPMMLGMVAALGLWTVWQSVRAGAGLRGTYETVRDRFIWAMRLLIPVISVVGIAVHFGRQGYGLGGFTAFALDKMIDAVARLYRFMLGLPQDTPTGLVFALVLAILALAVLMQKPGDRRLALYLIVIVVMPTAMAIMHLPNVEMSRYYLLPGVAFLLLLGDLTANLWGRGRLGSGAALLALLAVVVGNGLELRTFLRLGRGDVTGMLDRIVADGPGPITSNKERSDRPVISYFLKRMQIDIPLVDYHDVCATPPRWILTSDWSNNLPEQAVIGAPECRLAFRQVAHYESWGLSGSSWTLYRAAE
jgi:hypothetical protein